MEQNGNNCFIFKKIKEQKLELGLAFYWKQWYDLITQGADSAAPSI